MRKLIWAGIITIGVGLIVGFTPVSSHSASCGSAFIRSDDADTADLTHAIQRDSQGLGLPADRGSLSAAADACDSLRSVVRIPAFALLLVGAGLAVVPYATQQRRALSE